MLQVRENTKNQEEIPDEQIQSLRDLSTLKISYTFTCIPQIFVRNLPKWSKPRYLKVEALQVPQKVRTMLVSNLLSVIRISA